MLTISLGTKSGLAVSQLITAAVFRRLRGDSKGRGVGEVSERSSKFVLFPQPLSVSLKLSLNLRAFEIYVFF
eukprot:1333604-Amorphochlora_amoeboformis.AAC.1